MRGTTLREFSMFNDGYCQHPSCGEPRAEGAAVNGQMYCRAHAQAAIWNAVEEAAFCLLRYMGRDALNECIDGVLAYDGKPTFGYVS